jgi:uncharacterized coiled-coil protein SlyX
MTPEFIEQIEFKIAFLERANQELSDVVFRQQREIDALTGRLRAVSEQIDGLKTKATEYSQEEERPPHY